MTGSGTAGDFDVREDARAKINLALHVTGRRSDGYHLLDMLVTFAGHGDRLGFSSASEDRFTLDGRFADQLSQDAGGDNLVLKARDLLRQAIIETGGEVRPVHIHLEKNLPIASGIGGGSADAAATLRGLSHLWNTELPDDALSALAVRLGADVPMCLVSRPLVARGIGEEVELLADFPSFAMVLANPLVGVSTPSVFRGLVKRDNPPLAIHPRPHDIRQWTETIRSLRNDLEPPARLIAGEIAIVSTMLAEAGAGLVRMSGSGATCFGLFETPQSAARAADLMRKERPDWYFEATETTPGEASWQA
ncbi:4-(cytidine 5'-diphospho)-2-C-methyl-D-erythritol kinase [Rhizobium sp. BK251]|uniref:4-(cytidine 5'-diphospho)-2-C-methyl-D-erythritol kinase n=1 Tax=Rhizobium sp. BK251 TaxID=2512125 RepID=UPI001044708A|nr:4-(cytidine 5'-diphospho)-2-C-methyl-D-erythritol kinase [Rhizobium sp. BK251]TCL75853.1 4-diphosphocytidyl-2-C-methyl-D-erythritol kinase [Rhizobium sp. BK251]